MKKWFLIKMTEISPIVLLKQQNKSSLLECQTQGSLNLEAKLLYTIPLKPREIPQNYGNTWREWSRAEWTSRLKTSRNWQLVYSMSCLQQLQSPRCLPVVLPFPFSFFCMNRHIQFYLFWQRNYCFRCVAVVSCFLYERGLRLHSYRKQLATESQRQLNGN